MKKEGNKNSIPYREEKKRRGYTQHTHAHTQKKEKKRKEGGVKTDSGKRVCLCEGQQGECITLFHKKQGKVAA